MIFSEAHKTAVRANGAKSRGPKTEAGKRRSSRNGCTHNLYSRTPLAMPDETREDFAERLADYRAEFQPHTPAAERAVYEAALNMSLMWELVRIEEDMLRAETARQAALDPEAEPYLLMARAFLTTLQGRYSRRLYRAIDAADREKRAEMRNRTKAAAAAKRHREVPPPPKNSENEQPNQCGAGVSACPSGPWAAHQTRGLAPPPRPGPAPPLQPQKTAKVSNRTNRAAHAKRIRPQTMVSTKTKA